MPETVLVTGGAGYVGSHVVVELARGGYAPVVLDNFANSTPAVLPRLEALSGRPVPWVNADLRDLAAVRRVFHDHPIAAVVHCAGLKSIDESEERPLAYYDVNVGGALSLIEVMGEAGVAMLVFTSSGAAYGQSSASPIAEDTPLTPQNVYGRTKRVVEDFLRDLARANANWRIAILRCFNAAGAHTTGMLGEAPRGRPSGLITLLARVGAGEMSEIQIAGSDWPTADGTAIRDYVHIQDVALAHVQALKGLADSHGAITVNVGSGRGQSVTEIVAAFERACGRSIGQLPAPRRAGDLAVLIADVKRVHEALNWRATRSLDAICADAWKWQKSGGRL
ncbi:MAG TPA: UDP-glucose 4-epimerase GalE [Casimicrobiaceae bacterium]|jgi:UDP-glucose 4-epimerase